MKKINLLREFIHLVSERKLTSKARKSLPDDAFVFQKTRKYPIHDRSHARNALSRVSAHGSESEKKAVRSAVKKRYPDIEQSTTG